MRSAFTAIALLIRSTLGAWRGYPQIVPPQDCTCDAALGQQLSDLRKKHAAAAARLPPMTIMTYGFPHSLALPTSNVVGAAEYRQATTTALISRHIASPATAASLSSLARVLRDVGPLQSSGRVMMCPTAASAFGTAAAHDRALYPLEVMPCPAELQSQHACHTLYMEEIRLSMLVQQAANVSAPQLAAFVEMDQLWLGHPAALFVRGNVFVDADAQGDAHHGGMHGSLHRPSRRRNATWITMAQCDLVLTVHERAPYQGNLNSAVQLLRNTPALRDFWRDSVIPRTRNLAARECKGGQNQDATMAALGMARGRLLPGSSRVHAPSGLRACALSYRETVGTPILGEKVHASSEKLAEKVLPASSHRSAVSLVTRERVLCPEQFLRGDESLLSSAGGRDPGSPAGDEVKGGDRDDGSRRRRARRTSSSTLGDLSTDSALPDLRSVAMLHLKASQRYPTHEYAFALLHDCLTSATLAHDDRLASGEGRLAADARREYGSIALQILWARGVHTQGYHWNT